MKEFGGFNNDIITMNEELQKGGNFLQFDVSEKNMVFPMKHVMFKRNISFKNQNH